jgi:putative spermidine/putrescine transport system ATP-binding protein
MVFQGYALFPHMTVAENIAFGLQMRGVRGGEAARCVAEALEMVRLAPYADRLPRELSGGQQQRVALARAFAIKPDALLLDEPLSALDAKLRQQVRSEIRRLQQSLGLTTIFVTHDQEEAVSMADRIVVMNGGRIEQTGTPQEVYEKPATRFVAEFVGLSNFIPGTVEGPGRFRASQGTVLQFRHDGVVSSRGHLFVRPERIEVGAQAEGLVNSLSGEIDSIVFLGPFDRDLRAPCWRREDNRASSEPTDRRRRDATSRPKNDRRLGTGIRLCARRWLTGEPLDHEWTSDRTFVAIPWPPGSAGLLHILPVALWIAQCHRERQAG